MIKSYGSPAEVAEAVTRLEALAEQVDGLARVPSIIESAGSRLVLDRIDGPTVWELYREWVADPQGVTVPVPDLVMAGAQVLGRIHATPPAASSAGVLCPVFEEELAWASSSGPATDESDAVASHTDFAPVNLIVMPDGGLAVIDPEPNLYVTSGGSRFSRYVDLGIWYSALTMRAPLRQMRALRSPAVRRMAMGTLSAYTAETGVDLRQSAVDAHARATTSAYLRSLRIPRSASRAMVRRAAVGRPGSPAGLS